MIQRGAKFKKEFINDQWIVTCLCCGTRMAHFGWGLSGRSKYRQYQCKDCGRHTLNHEEPKPRY